MAGLLALTWILVIVLNIHNCRVLYKVNIRARLGPAGHRCGAVQKFCFFFLAGAVRKFSFRPVRFNFSFKSVRKKIFVFIKKEYGLRKISTQNKQFLLSFC